MPTAAETAQKELDKATADVEKKRKLLATCEERFEQAQTALDNAQTEVDEAIAISDWLSKHPLLAQEAANDPVPTPEEVVAAAAVPLPEPTEVTGQTTVEEQIATAPAPTPVAQAPAPAVDDLFATA